MTKMLSALGAEVRARTTWESMETQSSAESDPKLSLNRRRRCSATQHSKHLVNGILHSLSAFVHDVDTLRSQVTDLETIISLRDCYMNLVRTHVGSNGMRQKRRV